MSFEEWYDLHKDDISKKVELGLLLKDLFASAYEAGLHADVHTDNSAVIAKLEAQYDYAFNQLCKSREILCSMLSQYRDRKEIDYFTRECGEKLLKEGIYKND